jgi:hypothetical protein
MKPVRSLILILLLTGTLVLGGWWFLSRKDAGLRSPSELFAATPLHVTETFEVPPNRHIEWTFAPPQGRTRGTFEGRWSATGAAGGITGATDDTLISFELRGPDNTVLQKLERPTSGNFTIRFDGPGRATFVFGNEGIIRSSARRVRLDATYHPD